jgi:hypothetical protein
MRVEKTYYVGGHYGGASEAAIMKELRARGPVVGDFEVPSTFFYYTSGIFSDEADLILK